MKLIKQILIGVVIGIANIIPGVSGGTMAVSMGVYDKLIHAITHLIKEFKKSMKFLLPIGVGLIVALIGLAKLIEISLTQYPIPTNLFFIGLIVGGLPAVIKRLKDTKKKVNMGNWLAGIIFFAIVVGFALLGQSQAADSSVAFNFINVVKLFFVGMIASATMVIPGVSGSMVLMLMGYYENILESISKFVDGAIALDINAMLESAGVLIPFGIGVLAGVAIIAKVVEVMFRKYPNYAYCSIIGLIVASPIAIVLMSSVTSIEIVPAVIGVFTLAVGYIIAIKLGEK